MKQAHRVVGTSARRADAVAKVTGGARYTVDLSVPGMAYAFVVRSTRAHAAITGIDRTAAAASPGVIRVLIGDDLLAAGLTPYYGHVVLDHPVLAIERVRFQGEPVAVVVAETKREAAEAAELVDVSYEDLPVVIDAQEALKPDAPVLHERRGERVGDEGMDEGEKGLVGNVCAIARVEWGNIDEAFAGAHLVVEGEYRYPMLYGYAMEPYNALAFFDQGDLVVFSTAQHVYMVRRDLARMFHLPLARVRVSAPYVGGGYGTKSYTKVEGMTAAAAFFTGRAVKLDLSVEEAMLTTRSASAHIRARSAFTADAAPIAFRRCALSRAPCSPTPFPRAHCAGSARRRETSRASCRWTRRRRSSASIRSSCGSATSSGLARSSCPVSGRSTRTSRTTSAASRRPWSGRERASAARSDSACQRRTRVRIPHRPRRCASTPMRRSRSSPVRPSSAKARGPCSRRSSRRSSASPSRAWAW
ncbi:MAG: hypothetical protein E6H84_00230 [Chloroflexi bacterium]|nr:MAG: hypothetical protein E6H84_00230 [Chloroflexota bacterium]